MNIAIIGSGNVGSALASGLHKAGPDFRKKEVLAI